ncbi:MAG: 1-deoxy-D-xylulose-5-phosphate reductoisomerase [Spirochaetes bacterium]|nr:1-deoxy-D-xylulose-5-phosphate reductoisomerase [Spirochaetota bacterium]
MKLKRIIIAGSTGSIGTSTLDIVRQRPELFKVVGLSCNRNWEKLLSQIAEFSPEVAAVEQSLSADAKKTLESAVRNNHLNTEPVLYMKEQAVAEMVRETGADIVVNGISGSAGLFTSYWALQSGKDLALANKESIVMAGKLLFDLAEKKGRVILPVDSEHSAIFNLMRIIDRKAVDEIVLTASGGAFRDLSIKQLENVTVEDALQHPTWRMGAKITIDSASMANKGLEVIEASRLFDISPERIKVIIHPQSYVHSMIRTRDGMLYAQIGKPDMRLPILNALTYPEIKETGFNRLLLDNINMDFRRVDLEKYRMLALAYDAVTHGGAYPIVYNASNEAAVSMFIKNRIRFIDIPHVVEGSLNRNWPGDTDSLESIMEIDAKMVSEEYIG